MRELRPIAAFPRYFIGDDGAVFSTIRKGRQLKPTANNKGYLYVSLMDDAGQAHRRLVHRLVADAFLPPVLGKDLVNHKNGQKPDCRKENLEWCTYGENNDHARKTGLSLAFGETHYAAILREDDVRQIRILAAGGMFHKEIAADFGIARQTVTKIAGRKSWAHVE